MKLAIRVLAALAIALPPVIAGAQALSGQNYYYDDAVWPLPPDGETTALRLSGMKSAHAVWMTFSKFVDGKTVTDAPVITLLEGSTLRWTAPGGCSFELSLVNSNPPQINMRRPSSICSLLPGAKVIFKVLATP